MNSPLTSIFQRHPLKTIFFTALGIRLTWFIIIFICNDPKGFYTFDSGGYLQLARNLVYKHEFVRLFSDTLYPECFRTPGYPVFLMPFIFFQLPPIVIILVQLVFSAFTCVLATAICQNFSKNKITILISGLILAFDIPSILFANCILTETIFSFFIATGFYFLVRSIKRHSITLLFISGITLGISAMIRPSAIFLPLLILPVLFYLLSFRLKTIIHFMIFTSGFFLVLSPWLHRNHQLSGKYFLSMAGEEVFYFFNATSVNANLRDISLSKSRDELWTKLLLRTGKEGMEKSWVRAESEKAISSEMVRKNPGAFALAQLKGMIQFFLKPARGFIERQFGGYEEDYFPAEDELKTQTENYLGQTSLLTWILVFIQLMLSGIVWILFLAGTVQLFQKKEILLLIILLSVLIYFSLMIPGDQTDCRFRVPAMIVAAIGAAFGFEKIYGKLKIRNSRT